MIHKREMAQFRQQKTKRQGICIPLLDHVFIARVLTMHRYNLTSTYKS
jgi:hypothetical protein